MEKFFLRSFVGDIGTHDHPIEVSTTQFSSLFFATCPSASWMVAGYGKTVLDALTNLAELMNVVNRHASEHTRLGPVSRYILMVKTESEVTC